MIILSIIIPHYNSPEKLHRLLNSVPTRSDIQVIVVDDLSTAQIEQYNAVKNEFHDRVEFYSNLLENKGAGGARNIGLNHAKGTWLLFCDADDFLPENFSDIINRYTSRNEDIIYFPPESIMEGNTYPSHRCSDYSRLAYNAYYDIKHNVYDKKHLLELRYCWFSPCSKLIKTKLVLKNNIRFDNTQYSNDVMFSTAVGHNASNVSVGFEHIYIITEGTGTLTTSKNPKEGEIRAEVQSRYYKYCLSHINMQDKISLWGFGDFCTIFLRYNGGLLSKLYNAYYRYRYGNSY